jgi:hypothetical protein
MPVWEGIEDASAVPDAVWLSRTSIIETSTSSSGCGDKVYSVWKPLRKTDCQALNNHNNQAVAEVEGKRENVYIEGGRSTADLAAKVLHYNFYRGPDRELCSAVWFVREEIKGGKGEVLLHPVIDLADASKMEALYQKAVEATSSLGQGIASILSEPAILLEDGASSIQLQKSGKVLAIKKIPSGSWFNTNAQVLQRGYGQYEVLGEETEMALGPVAHLVFVVHGIGEALFSKHEGSKSMIAGVLDQTHTLRKDLQRKQLEGWKKECDKADKAGGTAHPLPPARIEVIPIEWFSRMHDSSSALMRSLKGSTLNTIPALRAIANDVVFDVLMYLTPAFCEAVLETVTEQINELYQTFLLVHPDFLAAGGKCSLAGHSLGSVICWDLLAVLKQSQIQMQSQLSNDPGNSSHDSPVEEPSDGVSNAEDESNTAKKDSNDATYASSPPVPTATAPLGYQAYAQAEHADKAQNGTYGPSLTKPMTKTIPFVPEHTLLLGSPLGIFLTLRGAHPVFDAERQSTTRGSGGGPSGEASGGVVSKVSPFTLPTKSLYNIFHPR